MIRRSTFLLLAAVLASGVSFFAQATAPAMSFDANADLLKMPNDMFLGPVGGVAANSKGQIFVYTRTGHPYATVGDNRTFVEAYKVVRAGSRRSTSWSGCLIVRYCFQRQSCLFQSPQR